MVTQDRFWKITLLGFLEIYNSWIIWKIQRERGHCISKWENPVFPSKRLSCTQRNIVCVGDFITQVSLIQFFCTEKNKRRAIFFFIQWNLEQQSEKLLSFSSVTVKFCALGAFNFLLQIMKRLNHMPLQLLSIYSLQVTLMALAVF